MPNAIRRSTAVATLLLAIALPPCAAAQTKLLRFPDVCGDRVVFTYGGDLWTVGVAGGTAVRLTADPGLEQAARFSPDCSRVAFTGQYGGDEQVYVIATAGGSARQLTYYPAIGPLPARWGFDNQVYGWTPDGADVLYRSTMDSFEAADPKLFLVAASGGEPRALPLPKSGAADYSPDGKRLVYSPLYRDFRTWKRYQGGWAHDLWLFDLASFETRNITHHVRTDRDPMWIGDDVYFLSDRDGYLNLYRYEIAADRTTQLTRHTEFDARWASADAAGRIVYEYGGGLRTYDTRDGSDQAIAIRVPDDVDLRRPETVDASKAIEQLAASPDGARALIAVRGELFTVPSDKGITRNLSHTPNAHEREAAWSYDGKQIAYVSDVSGEEALYLRDANGQGTATQLTRENLGRLYAPRWSPDSKRIAISDNEGRIHVVTVANRARTLVVDDPTELSRDYVWSPGSGYLAYTFTDDNNAPSIYLWSAADNRSTRVTDPLLAEVSPAFSPDGKYLYFIGFRDFTPLISLVEFNYAANRSAGIYALVLAKDTASPFPIQNDEAGAAKSDGASDDTKDEGAKDKDAKKAPQDRVDFDGLAERLVRVPLDPDNYAGLEVSATHLIYRLGDAFYYGRDGKIANQVVAYDIKERKATTVAEGIVGSAVSADGKYVFVQIGEDIKRFEIGGKAEDAKTLSRTGLVAERVRALEYAAIFDEVWRRYRDYFYAANMHGYDWAALREHYRPLLADVADRSDLNYLMGEMIGELNAGHAYVQGGDAGLPPRPTVALLGARFELDAKARRYRIASIMAGANDEERYRSPLTEVGVNVKVGDYVLAIDGRSLDAGTSPWALLRKPAGQPVELTVNAQPRAEGARTVLVNPRASEKELLYLAWVDHNRAYVDERSGGRLGYLHIPDMGADGIREFIKWYYPQLRKQGLVVDVRHNGGGNVSQMIIERLHRKLLGMGFGRGSQRGYTYPGGMFNGHLVALINETSASDGDIFSYMFKEAGLGPTIGKRTWGGVVGINDWGPVLDGGNVFVPQYATASADGRYVIEGEGVSPDIEVENDPAAVIAGRDPQLDRGIAELMRKVETAPRGLPPQPPDPVKTPDAVPSPVR